MSNKDIIKYFYEVVVSENLLDELCSVELSALYR